MNKLQLFEKKNISLIFTAIFFVAFISCGSPADRAERVAEKLIEQSINDDKSEVEVNLRPQDKNAPAGFQKISMVKDGKTTMSQYLGKDISKKEAIAIFIEWAEDKGWSRLDGEYDYTGYGEGGEFGIFAVELEKDDKTLNISITESGGQVVVMVAKEL